MNSRRLAAVALSLLTFAGCHDDPTVVGVVLTVSAQALALVATGGSASSAPGTDGSGGKGGDFRVTTNSLISLGSTAVAPSAPATPVPPSSFAFTATSPFAGTSQTGSIQIGGSVTTTGSTPIIVTSSNGDIVVSGTLQSGDTGTAQSDIHLMAPNGTVYISGQVRTAGVDGLSNGRSGGNLLINAARVVITGSIDSHGVANTTGTANGGAGGNVDISSSQGPIFFTGGSIFTAGGNCVDTGSHASIQGGAGGFVHLNSATGTNSVYVFAPITTDGGTMTGNGATPQGGNAGGVTIRGENDVNLVSTLSSQGGAATGTATDAVGGAGGSLSVDGGAAAGAGAATCRIYGSLTLSGGAAFATLSGGAVTGGLGGSVLLGQLKRLDSVEIGSGSYSMAGGSGQRNGGIGGGSGGTIAIESYDGDITIGASLSAAGGAATGAGNTGGGAAGTMKIVTDAQSAGNLSNHTLSISVPSSVLDASGGPALGTGAGGAGGSVLLQCGGNLTDAASINVSGGSSVTGAGGGTTPISPSIGGVDPTTAVALRITAASLTPSGALNVSGRIQVQGGVATSGGTGGAGSSITLQVAGGNGDLLCSGTLNSTGGSDTLGNGGAPGSLFLSTSGGNLDLSGSLTATGSASPTAPKAGGNVTLTGGGLLSSSAVINAAGGASTNILGLVVGGKGGAIKFDATGAFGGVTLLPGSSIVADGGSSASAAGGAGGSIDLQTRGQAIDMSGMLTARGGAASGAGVGGLGGQLIASSDFANSGTAGNITLESGSGIDMSGGTGATQGPAQWYPGPPGPPADPGATFSVPIQLAVIFDADGSFATSGTANPGRITNSGTITATGSTGGDVWYEGRNSLGAPLTVSDGTGLTLGGATPGHFYFH